MLYDEAGQPGPNLVNIAVYVDAYAKALGLRELSVDPSRLMAVAGALCRPDFPHVDGLEKASPFKKAANFFVWFVAERPILEELPVNLVGEKLKSVQNHQNVIFAYALAIDCLHGAKLQKGSEGDADEEVVLENRIKVSKHFFCDFVEAYSSATPQVHFKPVSLLLEQLAYKANPNASYPETV